MHGKGFGPSSAVSTPLLCHCDDMRRLVGWTLRKMLLRGQTWTRGAIASTSTTTRFLLDLLATRLSLSAASCRVAQPSSSLRSECISHNLQVADTGVPRRHMQVGANALNPHPTLKGIHEESRKSLVHLDIDACASREKADSLDDSSRRIAAADPDSAPACCGRRPNGSLSANPAAAMRRHMSKDLSDFSVALARTMSSSGDSEDANASSSTRKESPKLLATAGEEMGDRERLSLSRGRKSMQRTPTFVIQTGSQSGHDDGVTIWDYVCMY